MPCTTWVSSTFSSRASDDAVSSFSTGDEAQPNHANAHYELGKILLDRGQLKEAVDHLEIAARLSPETDYMHYQLQGAYRKLQRVAEADHELAIYRDLKAKQRAKAGMQSMQSR